MNENAIRTASDTGNDGASVSSTATEKRSDGQSLFDLVCQDLVDREAWEQRQATWYQIRHDGLRRLNKPFPGAADLHFPLVDGMIEKWKPFYFQQLYGSEVLATFTAKDPKQDAQAQEAAYWFDYKLKQCSNLERETLVTIDRMLMAGHVVLKILWDMARKRVRFEAMPAAKLIVPWHTKELEEADRITHVIEVSVEEYKRRANWSQAKEFIDRIKGRGGDDEGIDEEQERLVREGLTVASSDELIVVWEIYSRVGQKWFIDTIAPVCPDEPVRARFEMPYKHGEAPFVRFDHEVKENGHYSSRGLPEIAGAFETSLCKLWNQKHDFMAFANKPLFTTAQAIPNGSNLRISPGSVLPYGVTSVEMKAPPVSIDQEMTGTRMTAEYRVGMPDFGLGQESNTKDAKTATENRNRQALLNTGVDLKARMFRLSLAQVYRQSWQLLQQYDRDTAYFKEKEYRKLEDAALQGDFDVQPNGSSDSWNKDARLQKAVARKQIFTGAPWINQPELDKSILELDDPRLVARLFVDPEVKKATEYEEEAKLIPTILLGMPLSVRPDMDQVARVKCLVDFLEQRAAMGKEVPPEGIQAILARITQHVDALAQQNPKVGKQLAMEVEQKLQVMSMAQQMAAEEAGRMLGGAGMRNAEFGMRNGEGAAPPAMDAATARG